MTTHPLQILDLNLKCRPVLSVLGVALALLVCLSPLEGQDDIPVILFFGDSLTAGYGVEPEEAYPSLIRERLTRADLPHQVINAGLSGETTAAGLRRIDWILRRPVAIFVLALGGNDGLRGIPTDETQRNLDGILGKVRQRCPDAQLLVAGMEAPPNMGKTFTDAFRSIFPEVARNQDASLMPFLLEGVGGEPEFNLPDGIHPNPEGHQIIAANLWITLEPLLIPDARRGALQEDAPSHSNISKAGCDDTSPIQ